jgi:hypothetical protein
MFLIEFCVTRLNCISQSFQPISCIRAILTYKGGDSGAEQRGLRRVQLFGNFRNPGEVEGDVFGVSSIGQDPVDTLVLASRVVAWKRILHQSLRS